MATITKVEAWKNVGFSEEGSEAPHYGFSFPTADITINPADLRPATDRLFSEMRIGGEDWEKWRTVSYVRVTYSWNNPASPPSTTVLYGFVDSVDMISDTSSLSVISVKWHVDEWTTYLGNSSFGFGHVIRRPTSADEPIQGYTPRYWRVSGTEDAVPISTINGSEYWWVLVSYGAKANLGDTMFSRVGYYAWPINKLNTALYGQASGGSALPFIPYYSTLRGDWDELCDLSPDQVLGAWLLPCAPMGLSKWSGTGSSADPLEIASALTAGWAIIENDDGSFVRFSSSLLPQLTQDKLFPEYAAVSYVATPTERSPIRVLGFDAATLLELPINIGVTSYRYRVVASATDCYIEIRFNGSISRAEGLCAVAPALLLDLTQNSWSEYVYSGQRQYDIDSRNIASMQAMAEKAISGATQGFIMGGFNPAGAGATAAAGAVGGLVQGGLDLALFNPMLQETKDTLMANQSPGILRSGGGWDAMHNGITISFCTMTMDTYSSDRITAERSNMGVRVDEYFASDTTIRSSTGFYRIVDLTVKGNMPNSARHTIAQRFAKGVKLI